MEYNFVSVSIDVATQVILEDETPSPQDCLEWLTTLPEAGYKVSMSFHAEKGSYIVSISGKDSKHNKGLVMSQWGGSLGKCAQKCYMIHELVCKGDNWGMAEGLMADMIRQLLRANSPT